MPVVEDCTRMMLNPHDLLIGKDKRGDNERALRECSFYFDELSIAALHLFIYPSKEERSHSFWTEGLVSQLSYSTARGRLYGYSPEKAENQKVTKERETCGLKVGQSGFRSDALKRKPFNIRQSGNIGTSASQHVEYV